MKNAIIGYLLFLAVVISSCGTMPLREEGLIIKMPVPILSDTSGARPYGHILTMRSDSLVDGGIYEFSVDGGKTWKEGSTTFLVASGEIWARTRFQNLVSEITKSRFSIYYERVVVVGNSITQHGPLPASKWFGSWGMAASSADKDYLHQITTKLKQLNPEVKLMLSNGVAFENSYWTYNYDSLRTFVDFKPDLVIMRIGENVERDAGSEFENRYNAYIKTLIKDRKVKVICTTTVWSSHSQVGNRIKKVAQDNSYTLVDLQPLASDSSNFAFKMFSDRGVGAHPSDKGMQTIAELIGKAL
jgi:hypothetical protein